MPDPSDKLGQIRRKRVLTWVIRQVITACIVIPVVHTWPGWRWLYWVWIPLACASLVLNLLLLRRLKDQMESLAGDATAAAAIIDSDDPSGKKGEAWYDQKSKLMEAILGKEHTMVMHAIIPYAVGGGLDLYYYPHGVPGTAVATKELSDLPGVGPSNPDFRCYELVMFTRHALNLDQAKDDSTEFGRAHGLINSVLNRVARYSQSDGVTLNVNDTLEFPADMETLGGKCFLLAPFGAQPYDSAANFGLIAVMEVHRAEMEFARRESGAAMVQKLKDAGYYPYTDLDRPSLV